MAEFNLDDVEPRKREVVVLQTIQPHHALVKTNRLLLMLVFALMAVVFVMGLVIIPRQSFIEQIGRQRLSGATQQDTAISADINTLKSQMFGLVSGTIDSKIKSLEDNLRRGSIADSLESLQELKGDVKILTSYTPESTAKTEQTAVDKTVIKELSELKGLIYLTIVSCGLMIAALAGVWLRHRYRLNHQRPRAYLSRED
ncbi:hypothetical protein [Methylomonas sp. AM2-LC]|uniref:hypothetical protein n=1 Tax=Methylomonas sp. AM2-LC TaxID=3153301 RepID=UPI003264BF34